MEFTTKEHAQDYEERSTLWEADVKAAMQKAFGISKPGFNFLPPHSGWSNYPTALSYMMLDSDDYVNLRALFDQEDYHEPMCAEKLADYLEAKLTEDNSLGFSLAYWALSYVNTNELAAYLLDTMSETCEHCFGHGETNYYVKEVFEPCEVCGGSGRVGQ